MNPRYKTDPIERKMYVNDNLEVGSENPIWSSPCNYDAPMLSRITLYQYRTKRNWVKFIKSVCGL